MIYKIENQINEIINKYPQELFIANEFEEALHYFDKLVNNGVTQYRGNRVASQTNITQVHITFNKKN